MIIILTQCFPSRVGGIETLMYNLALHLSRSKDVIVLADQQNFKAVSYTHLTLPTKA